MSVNVTAAPTDQVAEGIYEYRLLIGSDNAPEARVNIYVSVTQSGVGNALFHLSDIYTATLAAQPNRTLVRYRIEVTDAPGESITVPYPDESPNHLPAELIGLA